MAGFCLKGSTYSVPPIPVYVASAQVAPQASTMLRERVNQYLAGDDPIVRVGKKDGRHSEQESAHRARTGP
jgi:hypothetical protein